MRPGSVNVTGHNRNFGPGDQTAEPRFERRHFTSAGSRPFGKQNVSAFIANSKLATQSSNLPAEPAQRIFARGIPEARLAQW